MFVHWHPKAVFDAAASHVPSTLVPAARLALCERVANSLPRATQSYYLECRLDQDQQVDFLVLTRHHDAARLFRDSLGAGPVDRAWQRTLDLFQDWSDGDATLREVPFFWLEYDIDERFNDSRPAASPGFCLEPRYLSRFRQSPIVDRKAAGKVAVAGLQRLLPDTEAERHNCVLTRCQSALPRGGSLIHVSAMLAREALRMKMYLAIPKLQIADYLHSIGWPGDVQLVERTLHRAYERIPETVFIDLSVGTDLEASLGIAFSQFHQTEMDESDASWDWVPMPGVSEAKRTAALSWPGVTETDIEGRRCWLHRWLDLKLVIGADGHARTKAYLGYMAAIPPPFS